MGNSITDYLKASQAANEAEPQLDVAKITYKEGDILVFQIKQVMPSASMERLAAGIKTNIELLFPDPDRRPKVMILANDMTLTVLSRED